MNTQGMINKLNKQFELRMNNKIKMVRVKIESLEVNNDYVLNNGYCIMHCKYIGYTDDISLNPILRLYEFEFKNNKGFIEIG